MLALETSGGEVGFGTQDLLREGMSWVVLVGCGPSQIKAAANCSIAIKERPEFLNIVATGEGNLALK